MKTIVTLFLLWSSVSMFAQQNNDLINTKFTEKSQYLFNEFVDGKVHLKSGMISSEKLNYNLFSGEICFIRNNTILEITNKKDILFIVLHDYKFYCFNEKYYFSIFNHKGTKILKTMKVDDEDANKVSGTYGISK
ncbi:MAG: hypothetical protein MI739_08905, partial [Bacteroidales bacterium]|nr:hypothetical protein [Bacteroidales bacterium]